MQDDESILFSEKNQVEVSKSAKTLGESWSLASVLKVIRGYFLVEYTY